MTAVMDTVDVACHTDDELAAGFLDADPGTPRWVALAAEIDRRDIATKRSHAARKRHVTSPWGASDSEWECAAYAQYLAAEEATRGCLLSAAGEATGRSPWPLLWQGSEDTARPFASEELTVWWDYTQARVPGPGEFRAAHHTQEMQAREEAMIGGLGGALVHGAERAASETVRLGTRAALRSGGNRPGGSQPAASRAERVAALRARAQELADRRSLAREDLPSAALAVRGSGDVSQGGRQAPGPHEMLRQCLDAAGMLLTGHVEFQSRAQAVAVTLWLAQAAAKDAAGDPVWLAFPRLLVTSQRNGSGKSTLGDISRLMLKTRAGRMSKVTPYGLTKIFGTYRETAILDDAQNVFRSDKAGADLLSIMINGYTPGATWVSGKSDGKVEDCSGSMMVIGKDALITARAKDLEDLIARSLVIRLDRPRLYMPELDRQSWARATAIGGVLAGVLATLSAELDQAAGDLAACLVGMEVTDPAGPRNAQIWRPLLAVAEVAGGPWPEAAQQAMDELASAGGDMLAAETELARATEMATGDGRSFWDEG